MGSIAGRGLSHKRDFVLRGRVSRPMFCKVSMLEQPDQREHAGENVMTLLSENAIVEAKPAGASNPVEGLLRLVSDVGLHRGPDGRIYGRGGGGRAP